MDVDIDIDINIDIDIDIDMNVDIRNVKRVKRWNVQCPGFAFNCIQCSVILSNKRGHLYRRWMVLLNRQRSSSNRRSQEPSCLSPDRYFIFKLCTKSLLFTLLVYLYCFYRATFDLPLLIAFILLGFFLFCF